MARWPPRLKPDPLFATLLLVLIWTAFGSGGSNIAVVHNPGTPTGACSLVVTATFATGPASLKHDLKLTVNGALARESSSWAQNPGRAEIC
jgi:hypothetical protein